MLFCRKKSNPYNHIIFKRGYIINKGKRLKPPHKHWKYQKVERFHIYYDPLNDIASCKRGRHWVFILGTAIDLLSPSLNLDDISKKLLNYLRESEESFFDYLDYLSGRYLILYNDGEDSKVLSDATGMRSIFYNAEKNIISSHYKLVNKYVEAPSSSIVKKEWLGKYSNYHLPGHYTPLEGILFLTPNT